MKSRYRYHAVAVVAMLLCSSFAAGQTAVITYKNDNYRTGLNPNETVLTPANVNQLRFGKRLVLPVQGYVYAQPLYVPQVNINGTPHNMVYVATEHDQVYGFDANTGQQMWQTSFIGQVGSRLIETVTSDELDCPDLVPEIGITSTPIIDLSTNRIFLVAKTKETVNQLTSYFQRMHVLDIRTGREFIGGPFFGAPITAKTPGSGVGSQNGYLIFDPKVEHQRAALAMSNGLIMVSWAAHCDLGPYHGYVMAFSKNSLRPTGVYVSTPNGYDGGVWESGSGPAVDANGGIYVATGNGLFDANIGGKDYSDSILKLSWAGINPAVVDYFTPWDQALLNSKDLDVSSGSVMLLPDQPGAPYPHLLVNAGKEGTIDLVDRDSMGHFHAGGDTQILQSLRDIFPGIWGSPATWNNNIYYGSFHAPLESFAYDPVGQQIDAQYTSASPEIFTYPGPSPSVSSNGSANAIVWAIEADTYHGGNSILRAYDATNLANELYNSNLNQGRDQAGGAVKFSVPTIADGQVFVGSAGEVDVYGLLN